MARGVGGGASGRRRAGTGAWREEFRGQLRHDGWTDERPLWWLARHDDAPVGWLSLAYPQADNRGLAAEAAAIEASMNDAPMETDNAGSNRHMIAVNETIGFESADSLIAYQLPLS
ncbi:MAG: hypothetical protein M3Y91_03645 [Actinomycetota bacterium]|nr:hypothetical protein [Actinomycetota bacterium]